MDGGRFEAKRVDIFLGAIILGFALGIVFQAACPFVGGFSLYVWGGGFAAALLLLFLIPKRKRSTTAVFFLFLLAFFLGGFRFEKSLPDTSSFEKMIGTRVSLSGMAEDTGSKGFGQSFVLDTDSGINISVSMGADPAVAYGDMVTVAGTLLLPQNFTTDQGTEFDYVSYLYKDNIFYQIKNAKVAIVSSGNGSSLLAYLQSFEEKILQSFNNVLPGNDANLLAGLDLGEKSSIDPKFRDALVTTGTIHIIALSGYNVSIVATFLRAMLSEIPVLGTFGASLGGAFGIVLFVAMTGLQSSAIRAGIMALISLFARQRGCAYDAFRALVFAGFLMILFDPKYLVYDVSFQLSFLATLGIIFITPLLERKFSRVPKDILGILPLRELMSATLGAQIGVLPFILYKMGTLSLIALPTNILILPAIPFAMGTGALAGLVGMLSIPLAYPIVLVTHLLLSYITSVITFLASVPYASLSIQHFPIILCLALYAALFAVLYRMWRKSD